MSRVNGEKAKNSAAQSWEAGPAWFCIRTQWKHEHIAAGHLRQMEEIEVFAPRVRFTRVTRNGPVVVTEAMFPTYIFAKFEWKNSLNRVNYAPSVIGVVHFGDRWPTIPDSVVATLRTITGPEEIQEISKDFKPGQTVEVVGGAFHGLEAVITKVLPGKERVALLMDFLGRQTTIEVSTRSILRVVQD